MIRPERPQMCWDYHRSRHPLNPQWRHPAGPRNPFRGQPQRFMQQRSAFQPGNDNYWCETCDRGFPTEEILGKHAQQHQKCNIDGCQFIAHPKVITKHIQMQHSTGLYKKIANLKNPEDIEKWREERRKKYPTKINIEKKAAELKEKIDRGEKMGLKGKRNHRDGYNSTQNRENNNSEQGLKRRNNTQSKYQPYTKYIKTGGNNNHHKKSTQMTKPKILPIVEETRKLKPFAGILNLQMDSDNEVEDDITGTNIAIEDDDDYLEESKSDVSKPVADIVEPVVCGALSSLICDYASSDEENPKEVVSKIILENINVNQEPSKSNQDKNLAEPIPKINENSETETHNNRNSSLQVVKTEDKVEKCTDTTQNQKNEDCQEVVPNTSKLKNGLSNDDDSGPEEVNTEVHKKQDITSTENIKTKVNLKKKVSKEKKLPLQHPKRKLPSTLLQKLLFKEMQQERNIILQCIRYIRKNDYFDKK